MALKVIKEGLLKRPKDAAIGYARIGLSSLAGLPGQRFIEERGGSVILRRTVRTLIRDSETICGAQLSDGSNLEADAFVSALPHDALLDCLPPESAEDPFFAAVAGLQSSPIVGVHLWYDRHVMDEPFVAFINSPIQWVFNRSLIQGDGSSPGQYVCISLSGAWQYIDRPKGELRELFGREMERLFPRGARRRNREVADNQAAEGYLQVRAGSKPNPTTPNDAYSESLPGGRLDRYRLAIHHGGRCAQRGLCRQCACQEIHGPATSLTLSWAGC